MPKPKARLVPVCVLAIAPDGEAFESARRLFFGDRLGVTDAAIVSVAFGKVVYEIEFKDPIGFEQVRSSMDKFFINNTSFILCYHVSSVSSFVTLRRYCALISRRRESAFGGLVIALTSDAGAAPEVPQAWGEDLAKRYACVFYQVPARTLHERTAPWDRMLNALTDYVRLVLEYRAVETWRPADEADVCMKVASLARWLSRCPLRHQGEMPALHALQFVKVFLPSLSLNARELHGPCKFVDVIRLAAKSLGATGPADEFFLDERRVKKAFPEAGDDERLEDLLLHLETLLEIWPGAVVSQNVFTLRVPQLLSVDAAENFETYCATYNSSYGHPQTTEAHMHRMHEWLKAYRQLPPRRPTSLFRKHDWLDPVSDTILSPKNSKRNTCVKVLLLGHSAAGKTSLVKALRQTLQRDAAPVSLQEEATIGVETHTFVDGALEYALWDFAGQSEYMATHQHFLSTSCALYLVVVDVSKPLDAQRAEMQRWLAALQLKLYHLRDRSSVRVIVVGNKIDLLRDRFDADIAADPLLATMESWKLPYHPSASKRIVFVSCVKEAGVRALRQLIGEEAREMLQFSAGPISEEELHSAMAKLAAMRGEGPAQRDPVSLVTMAEADAIEHFPGAQLAALADRGLILWHRDARTVCLSPPALGRVVSLFTSPADHRKRLLSPQSSGHEYGARDPVVPLPTAMELMRGLRELQAAPDERLMELLKSLEAIGVCYQLTDAEAAAYEQSGLLFPSLLPACDTLHLPWQPQPPGAKTRVVAGQWRLLATVGSAAEYFARLQVRVRILHDARCRLYANCALLQYDANAALAALMESDTQWWIRIVARGPKPRRVIKQVLRLSTLAELPFEHLCAECAHNMHFEKVEELQAEGSDSELVKCSAGHVNSAKRGWRVDSQAPRTWLWSPKEGERFNSACQWQTRGNSVRHCTLSDADTSTAKRAEWVRIQQQFYRFVGADTHFQLERAVYLHNEGLERDFAAAFDEITTERAEPDRIADFKSGFDAQDSPADVRWRRWMLRQLQHSVERVSSTGRANMIAGWYSAQQEAVWDIAERGFKSGEEDSNKGRADAAGGERGLHFTQLASSGGAYAPALEAGASGCLLFSWVLAGRAYPVIEASAAHEALLSKGRVAGYHSHYSVVRRVGGALVPCPVTHPPESDRLVVFSARQVLPRYIVYFRRLATPPLRPLLLPVSSSSPRSSPHSPLSSPHSPLSTTSPHTPSSSERHEQIDKASHTHPPLTVLWVDSSFASGAQDAIVMTLCKGEKGSARAILTFVCTEELKVWLRMHKSCFTKHARDLRLITNRRRDVDGGESAGEALIAWIRGNEVRAWREIKCLLYCKEVQKVAHVREAGTTFVSSDALTLHGFCAPNVDWKALK